MAELPEVISKYPRGMKDYHLAIHKDTKRDFKTHVTVIVGATGLGKSALAAGWPKVVKVPKPKGEPWFDGYISIEHQTMWIDDYRGNYKFDFFLELLDRYELLLPVKGSFEPMLARNIVITSNRKPREWYEGLFAKRPDEYQALKRRIDCYIKFTGWNRIRLVHGEIPLEVNVPDLPENAPDDMDWSCEEAEPVPLAPPWQQARRDWLDANAQAHAQ